MRIMIMFDLPTLTSSEQRRYRTFRNFLIKNGFIMMQESIYIKLAINPTSADLIKEKVKQNLPKDGLVQMLTITEKQFHRMEFLLGEGQDVYIDSDSRLIEL